MVIRIGLVIIAAVSENIAAELLMTIFMFYRCRSNNYNEPAVKSKRRHAKRRQPVEVFILGVNEAIGQSIVYILHGETEKLHPLLSLD